MDIILAMIADSAAKKLEEKRWYAFPSSIERNAEVGEYSNYALYRYLVQNAILYPQEWVLNSYGAKVLAQVQISGETIRIDNIEILQKTDGLSDESIKQEVIKTLNRARKDFPALSDSDNSFVLPIEWKIVGCVKTL